MIASIQRFERVATNLLKRTVELDRRAKFSLAVAIDATLCVVSVIVGFSIRFGEWDLWNAAIRTVSIACLALWLPTFIYLRIYQTVVRFIGLRTIMAIAGGCIAMAIGLAIIFTINSVPGVPRTIALIQPMLFGGLLVCSRLIGRYILLDVLTQRATAGPRSRVLIYGTGPAGRQLALALRHEPTMTVVGYLEDDSHLVGQRVDGIRIHSAADPIEVIHDQAIDTVLLAVAGVSNHERKQIVQKFENARVRVLTLPAFGDLLDGSVSIADLRDIEIEDLLGRDPVPPSQELLERTIGGKTVLITGAGGSIGSELCRQISRLNPDSIVLAEMTEHTLYMIDNELREAMARGDLAAGTTIHSELCNVSSEHVVRRLFSRYRPHTVFHAAAYKHVPLVEENALAGIFNNIRATYLCALEAESHGADHFILISTDKAVRPANIMGASKRVCELVLQALADRGSRTVFAIVRFGNVLGSSGSVVPRFQKQIREGGPVTLTHREITRFFMTISEASQLVIQAGAMARGGEVFVLDMGEPIKIYDLARTMINLTGLSVRDEANPRGDIEIREIGLRKGEKLFEETLIGNSPMATSHPRIVQAREELLDWSALSSNLDELFAHLDHGNREGAISSLLDFVPEYEGPHRRPVAAMDEILAKN